MVKGLFWLVALAIVLVPRGAAEGQAKTAESAEEARYRLGLALSGYEPSVDESFVRTVEPFAAEALIAIYRDPDTPGYVRLRALGALSLCAPSSRALRFLRGIVTLPDQSDLVLREASLALGAFGSRAGGPLLTLLGHRSRMVRESAAMAIAMAWSRERGAIGQSRPTGGAATIHRKAVLALERARLRERDVVVREALGRALANVRSGETCSSPECKRSAGR